MSDAFDTTWLFTRGTESIKLTRVAAEGGSYRVVVAGPGPTVATHLCDSLAECMRLHQKLDAELMAQGYQLSRTPDRRGNADRRRQTRGPGRRRP